MAMRCRTLFVAVVVMWGLAIGFLGVASTAGDVALTIDGSQLFQTIDGFGVNANSGSWNGGELRQALDILVDQLGATIWRVILDNADWEATNDNVDPNTFNWTYYNAVYTTPKFEALWGMMSYLNQKGITTNILLNFMGPVPAWMGGSHIATTAEDEWVEMIASAVYYARHTRGLQFSLLTPMNEPDWNGIEGPQVDSSQYARLMQKLSEKLDALGLSSIHFAGPDTASVDIGVNDYFPELLANPAVMAKLDHFGLHNYAGYSGGADRVIKTSAYPTKTFWITEVTNIWDILNHLSQGPTAVLVWDAYDSYYNHVGGPDPGNGPALLAYDATSGLYTPRQGFYECAQLFKFVMPGARRMSATASDGNLAVYAFSHPVSGDLTIVGRNAGSSNITLAGTLTHLPAVSTLAFYETNASENLQRGADVPVINGSFSVTVNATSVFTLTTVSTPTPPAAPVAAFSAAPSSGRVPLTVNFADASSGSIISWAWDFGDGQTSMAQNPSHTYTAPGRYTVSLAVSGPGGANTASKPHYITVKRHLWRVEGMRLP